MQKLEEANDEKLVNEDVRQYLGFLESFKDNEINVVLSVRC